MKKADVISILGGKQKDVARLLGITDSAVSQWPEKLPPAVVDRIVGAAMRAGLKSASKQLMKVR